MRIEDLVLLVGSLILSAGLVPSIVGPNKPSKWTSLMTIIILGAFIWVDLRLHLPGAAGAQALGAVLWLILGAQKLRAEVTQ